MVRNTHADDRTNTDDLRCRKCDATASYAYAARTHGKDICGQTYDDSGRGNEDGEKHDWVEA